MRSSLPEHSSRPRWFRRHPRLALVFLLLGMTVVLDFSLGSVLFAAGVRLPAMKPDPSYRSRHPVYHHGLRPLATHEGQWGDKHYRVFVNSLAMRDAEAREVPLKSTTKRVLLIGDSFTEGVGVNFPETYAGRLVERFKGQGLEFLNAGISSYSPIIYYRKIQYLLEEVGLQVDHVSVGIDMSDIFNETGYWFDDERRVCHKHDASASATTKRFLARHTVLIGTLRVWLRRLRKGAEAPNPLGIDNHHCLWANEESLWQSFGARGAERAVKHMDLLHDFLQARGITMNVFVYPWPDQIVRRDLDCRQVQIWRDWSKKRGVDFQDLFPEFCTDPDPEAAVRRWYIPGDVHWNAQGHEVVATRMAAYFETLRQRRP